MCGLSRIDFGLSSDFYCGELGAALFSGRLLALSIPVFSLSKHVFPKLLQIMALLPAARRAQVFPAVPAVPPTNLPDQALRDRLRTNWYNGKRTALTYSAARAKTYYTPTTTTTQ